MTSDPGRQRFDLQTGDALICESPVIGKVEIVMLGISSSDGREEVEFGLILPDGMYVDIDGARLETSGYPRCTGISRIFIVLSFLLRKKTREDLFLPSFNELLEDYLFSRKKFRRRWERKYLFFAHFAKSTSLLSWCLSNDFRRVLHLAASLLFLKWLLSRQ